MTRKRFIKLLMANGYPRNYAYSCAEDGSICMSYADLYEEYFNIWQSKRERVYQSLTKSFYVIKKLLINCKIN